MSITTITNICFPTAPECLIPSNCMVITYDQFVEMRYQLTGWSVSFSGNLTTNGIPVGYDGASDPLIFPPSALSETSDQVCGPNTASYYQIDEFGSYADHEANILGTAWYKDGTGTSSNYYFCPYISLAYTVFGYAVTEGTSIACDPCGVAYPFRCDDWNTLNECSTGNASQYAIIGTVTTPYGSCPLWGYYGKFSNDPPPTANAFAGYLNATMTVTP